MMQWWMLHSNAVLNMLFDVFAILVEMPQHLEEMPQHQVEMLQIHSMQSSVGWLFFHFSIWK